MLTWCDDVESVCGNTFHITVSSVLGNWPFVLGNHQPVSEEEIWWFVFLSKSKSISQLSFIQYIWVSSAYPILLWWAWGCVFYLIIIIKLEGWIINHFLGLGHKAIVHVISLTCSYSYRKCQDYVYKQYVVILLMLLLTAYRQISNIRHTSIVNKIVDHSDEVGAAPVGAAPTTSSFSTLHLASVDWAKINARWDKKDSSFGIRCDLC